MSAKVTASKGSKTLKRKEFFRAVRDGATINLPERMREFQSRSTMNLLKIHYQANYRIHYEAMISTGSGFLELGLHFEDGPESTSKLLEHFDRHILEIKHELGVQCELERWTKSWGHLFEVHTLEPLTRSYAERIAGRCAAFIIVLQPLLDDAFERGLVAVEPRPSTFGGRFRRKRRS